MQRVETYLNVEDARLLNAEATKKGKTLYAFIQDTLLERLHPPKQATLPAQPVSKPPKHKTKFYAEGVLKPTHLLDPFLPPRLDPPPVEAVGLEQSTLVSTRGYIRPPVSPPDPAGSRHRTHFKPDF